MIALRIKKPGRTSSAIAGFLGISGGGIEPRRKRNIRTGIMTRKGIRVKKRFTNSGSKIFEQAKAREKQA